MKHSTGIYVFLTIAVIISYFEYPIEVNYILCNLMVDCVVILKKPTSSIYTNQSEKCDFNHYW